MRLTVFDRNRCQQNNNDDFESKDYVGLKDFVSQIRNSYRILIKSELWPSQCTNWGLGAGGGHHFFSASQKHANIILLKDKATTALMFSLCREDSRTKLERLQHQHFLLWIELFARKAVCLWIACSSFPALGINPRSLIHARFCSSRFSYSHIPLQLEEIAWN